MSKQFVADCRAFANQWTSLLNSTVCQGIRLKCVTWPKVNPPVANIGYEITRDNLETVGIPLTISRAPARLHLGLSSRLELDSEGTYVMSRSSVFVLATDQALNSVLLHYDFERDKQDDWPEAHLHVVGESPAWVWALDGKNELGALHLPVGPRRFRPTLEDLIEFLINEKLVQAHSDWKASPHGGT